MGFRIPHVLVLVALLLWVGASQVMAGSSMLCEGMACSQQVSAGHSDAMTHAKDAQCAIACDLMCAGVLLPQNISRADQLWRDLHRPHATLYIRETDRITPDRPPIVI